MNDPIHAEDGSPLRAKPLTERPFNHPMSASDPAPGVDKEGSEGGESPVVDPRTALIEKMSDANDEDRLGEVQGGTVDGLLPGSAESEPASTPDDADGAASLEALHPETPKAEPVLPAELQADPMADFIMLDENDQPVVVLKVDGQETTIPLERARQQLQKHEAAEVRLQQASEWQKTLANREVEIRKSEAALEAKKQELLSPPPAPVADVDDASIEAEAREVVTGLFTGTEDEATVKLANLIKSSRAAPQAPPQVDPDQLVGRAVTAAKQAIKAEDRTRDINSGFAKFKDDYPDILADPNLYRMADGLTDTIEAEHPDWEPSRVMATAGEQVRDWVKAMRGPAPEQSEEPGNDNRQERKRNLRPLPSARQGVPEKETAEQPETPASMLEEIRSQRGQPV